MIIVDLQTTGWNEQEDSIVSIGAVDFRNPERLFHQKSRIPPGTSISPEATRAFHFDRRTLFDQSRPSLRSILRDFVTWAEVSDLRILAGQNPWFDAAFLRESLRRYHLPWLFGYRLVDLHSIFYSRLLLLGKEIPNANGVDSLSLDVILRHVGLEHKAAANSALTNAKLEAEAFSRLIHGKGLLKEYEAYRIPRS